MTIDGAAGAGHPSVKSAGFDYSFSFTDKKDEDVKPKKYGDPNVSGVFTAPQVAFHHSTGGRDDGAFNA